MSTSSASALPLTPSEWRVLAAALAFASDEHAARTLTLVAARATEPSIVKQAFADPRCAPSTLATAAESLLITWKATRSSAAADVIDLLRPIAWNRATPPDQIDLLARAGHPDLALAAALNPSTRPATLEMILTLGHPEAAAAAARHPAMPPAALRLLLQHDNLAVVDAAFGHPRTPIDAILDALGATPDPVRWCAAARNVSLPADVLTDWVTRGRATVRRIAASNPALPATALPDLAWANTGRHQASVARNPNISWDLAHHLSSPGYQADTRFALAGNPAVPLDIAVALLVDPDPKVRSHLLRTRPDLPGAVLAQAVADETSSRVLAAAAEHPNMPDQATTDLIGRAGKERSSILYAVASRPAGLSPAVTGLIAEQARGSARDRFAARPECPTDVLDDIARRGSSRARAHAAVNPGLPDRLAATLEEASPAVTFLVRGR